MIIAATTWCPSILTLEDHCAKRIFPYVPYSIQLRLQSHNYAEVHVWALMCCILLTLTLSEPSFISTLFCERQLLRQLEIVFKLVVGSGELSPFPAVFLSGTGGLLRRVRWRRVGRLQCRRRMSSFELRVVDLCSTVADLWLRKRLERLFAESLLSLRFRRIRGFEGGENTLALGGSTRSYCIDAFSPPRCERRALFVRRPFLSQLRQ